MGTPTPETEARKLEVTRELERLSATGRAEVRQLRFEVVEGPDAGASADSSGARFVLGGDETADLVLTDPTVSRFHCEVRLESGRPLVVDLGSLNGTAIDGVEVRSAFLRPGAVLAMGATRVRVDQPGGSNALAVSPKERFGTMVGRSPAMRAAFALLERAAASEATVLLGGETGTGKEIAAESVHRESPRRDGPFIVVDCGAIPASLIESELFGHVKGAFTGAQSSRQGAFEAAAGGTLFLDEVGELPLEMQPKLLRALERREIKRVGENKHVPIDVRVIAATHRDLREEINEGRFRTDLYYRLAVVGIRLPALRERPGDLPLLVDHVLQSLDAANRPEAAPLREGPLREALSRHAWPGNVRELRNYVERCLALGQYQAPDREAPPAAPGAEFQLPLRAARDAFERRYLASLLQSQGDNLAAAARTAGVDRANLYRLLWKHGLR
ncbi:MAG TPA: sigma 54-interacting transcriptional regulator [Myxococcaceae bacterium]|jgi:DNA-binding NtrC family response regulator